MKTNILPEKSVNFVDDAVIGLICAVPTVKKNYSLDFSLIYNSETGKVFKDIRQIVSEGSDNFSFIDLSVNSDGVRGLPEHVYSFDSADVEGFIDEVCEGLEPYQVAELDFNVLFKNEKCRCRAFGSREGDYVLLKAIRAYNRLV
ncbi:hypothetical protein DRJ22_01015 [Candidatus Woesearchaeota archaeon]|nr:MAG: hypothetical protein B6U93_01655 [Candidatus Woesearchaeota archaeon ex4484_78]RLE46781.1 MAG: hypothetical protein DRJ22_01015 [Candidatus Woesearchaeota archaeon]